MASKVKKARVYKWNELSPMRIEYDHVVHEALRATFGFDEDDVVNVQWGNARRARQEVYRVYFTDGSFEIVYGSTDGERFHAEGLKY